MGRNVWTSDSGDLHCDGLALLHVAGVFPWHVEPVHNDQLDTCHLAEQFTHGGASIVAPVINYSQKIFLGLGF